MYPSLIFQNIETSLKEFIVTGYETDTPHFRGKFRAFMYDDANGGKKGPKPNGTYLNSKALK